MLKCDIAIAAEARGAVGLLARLGAEVVGGDPAGALRQGPTAAGGAVVLVDGLATGLGAGGTAGAVVALDVNPVAVHLRRAPRLGADSLRWKSFTVLVLVSHLFLLKGFHESKKNTN